MFSIQKVAYCSKECQTRHWWNGHNRQCKLLQAQEALENNNNNNNHTSSEKKTVAPLPSKITSSTKPTNLPFTRQPSRILFSRKRIQQMCEFEDKSLPLGIHLKTVSSFLRFVFVILRLSFFTHVERMWFAKCGQQLLSEFCSTMSHLHTTTY